MMTTDFSGGELLAHSLLANGADLAFCVPGESYLAALDALYDVRDRLRLVVCRQEGGAAYMAEAYGKLTGRPGLAFVTRGPGASNACVGVHTAQQDSTPMILLIGQVGSDFVDREAFQEVDYRRMYAPLVKWAAQIDRADRVPEYIARAYHVATSGRPGPVVLALPEDMLAARATATAIPVGLTTCGHPSAAQVQAIRERLTQASAPLVIAGGSGWTVAACDDLRRFVEANALPVACGFRNQDLLDNRHPNYIGDIGIGVNPKLAARVRAADLLLVLGERLGEMVTGGYEHPSVAQRSQQLVHVHPGEIEVGRVYPPELGIVASMPSIASALAAMPPLTDPPWVASVEAARRDYLDWQRPRPMAGALDLWQVLATLRAKLPADTIVANGAGNFATWMHRLWPYAGFRTQLGPYSGSMGYGLPAAVAAKLVHPERMVVAWTGDGDYLMNGQELATAVQEEAPLLVFVVNNGMYGTIRMHQERTYPGRVHGSRLGNPDFAALAAAFGAHGEAVSRTADFAPALDRALAALAGGASALLELRVDPAQITPGATIEELRSRAARR